MPALQMTITDLGLDALVDAQGSGADEILIADLGLSSMPFVASRTLTDLPGLFKFIEAVSGETVSENIIHLTAYDTSQETYDVTGLGLFLDDGTLFAVYSAAAGPVLTKAELAFALFSLDISFDNTIDASITFGNEVFSFPPASETVKGVAKLATQQLAVEGLDDQTIMTPALVKLIIASALPSGFIGNWSGAIANIPDGWLLCDGNDGTPDLRNQFIVGAGDLYGVAASGGSLEHDHEGTVEGHALTAAQMPEHRHHVAVNGEGSAALTGQNSISDITRVNENQEYDLHSLAGEPTLGLTSASGDGADHGHGLTVENSSNLPPYFALAFIMKA